MEHTTHTAHALRLRGDSGTRVSSLQIVCAWCQQPLAWYRVQTPLPFPISYSICGRCYTAVAREIASRTAGAAAPGLHAS
jgi:hypothetical protein